MVQLMPLPPIICCSSKIQNGLTFLMQAYPGCPGKEIVIITLVVYTADVVVAIRLLYAVTILSVHYLPVTLVIVSKHQLLWSSFLNTKHHVIFGKRYRRQGHYEGDITKMIQDS